MSPPHHSMKTSGEEMLNSPSRTSPRYYTDWRDTARHFSNACFVVSYVCLTNGMMVLGSCFTLFGESLLAPSAIKHRSWSTLIVGGIFLALALGTIARSLLG